MNLLKLLLLLLLFNRPFKAMDCFANRTFKNMPLSTEEKNSLLGLLRTSQITLDENENNVLHMAAAIKEYPELVTDILLDRPDLVGYLDTPNKQGITPRDLMLRLNTKKTSLNNSNTSKDQSLATVLNSLKGSQVTVIQIPKQTIQQSIEELDNSITAKVVLFHQNRHYEPFTLTEKARIIRIILDMPHPTGGTCLHGAVDFQGYPELTKDLLAFKPELRHLMNTPDGFGITPLKRAIIRNNWPAVETLMAAGAL